MSEEGSENMEGEDPYSGSQMGDTATDSASFSDDDGIVVDPPVFTMSDPFESSGDCQVLEPEQVTAEIQKIMNELAVIVRLPPTVCRLLLHHHKWNKERLLEKFYESSNPDAFFADAHVILPSKTHRRSNDSKGIKDCAICCNETNLTGLMCGHLFCAECWDTYLSTKIMEEGFAYVACPELDCQIVVDDEKTLEWVTSDEVKKRYRHLIINSFVECNRLLRWCPAVDCGRVIKVNQPEARPVLCKCSTVFCFECANEWHEPVNCRLLKLWLKKCNDDSETSNWISANTKECPKCQATIEKDGGCNHMKCKNSACKMEFCWMCLGPWEPHGNSWYSCNRFDDSIAKQARDTQAQGRATLQRYLHFYNRFMNHRQSLKLEKNLYTAVKSKMETMQQGNMSWIEVQFLRKAVDVLSECRRTLMYTYAFAFYLQKNNQLEIFEVNQSDLEMATEQLSDFLEHDLNYEKVETIKQKVQDKSHYVEKRRTTLLKHCTEGVEKDFWSFAK